MIDKVTVTGSVARDVKKMTDDVRFVGSNPARCRRAASASAFDKFGSLTSDFANSAYPTF